MFYLNPKRLIKVIGIAIVLFLILFGIDKYVYLHGVKTPPSSFIILWLAVILFYGKISGAIERLGQPSVLGELIMGGILGNIALLGIHFMQPVKTDPTIDFLMQLGTIILFFQAGLATDLRNIRSFFWKALGLAIIGLTLSVGIFYFTLPFFIKDIPPIVILYLALTLAPTGVGETARILQDLGKLKLKSSQLIISAGALDNIICFIIQAVLIAFIRDSTIHFTQTGILTAEVLGLILAIILFGVLILPFAVKFLAGIYSERSLKFALTFGIALFAAYFAQSIGVSPVIGAFWAGVAINPNYFTFFKYSPLLTQIESMLSMKMLLMKKTGESTKTIKQAEIQDLESMFTTPAFLLVSIFFVVTGMSIDLKMLISPQFLLAAIFFTLLAFGAKILAAFIIEKRVKSITGIGMSPKGVPTLVFAEIGRRIGILTPELVSLIVFIVMMTTLIAPIIMTRLFKKMKIDQPNMVTAKKMGYLTIPVKG